MNESHILYAYEEFINSRDYAVVEKDLISQLTLSHRYEKRFTLFAPHQSLFCSSYTFALPDLPDEIQPGVVRFLSSKFTYLSLTLLCAAGNVFCLTCAQLQADNYHLRLTLERRPLGVVTAHPITMIEDAAPLLVKE
jgi:hypothetical protein